MTTVDIRTHISVPCEGGVLTFEPDGRLTAAGSSGVEHTVVAPDLALSDQVEVWCGGGRAYVVGLAGKAVWFAIPSKAVLTEVLELDRLDLRRSYDPGGLHHVDFHELADGDLLIIHELGLARLGRDGSVRWHRGHNDLTAQFDRIADSTAWFQSESGHFGFMLSDGRRRTLL